MERIEPNYLDEVKNTVSGVTGIVDDTYVLAGVKYLDVIVDDDMWYKSPAKNWEITVKYTPWNSRKLHTL